MFRILSQSRYGYEQQHQQQQRWFSMPSSHGAATTATTLTNTDVHNEKEDDQGSKQQQLQHHEEHEEQHQSHPNLPERFDELNELYHLHPKTLKALRRNAIHKMTEIQQLTYKPILDGSNVVARSRTGSGKTLAFLVPALERYIQHQQQQKEDEDENREIVPTGIPILIIAPTRELAAQIGSEAQKLLSVHTSTRMTVQVMHGGSGGDGGGGRGRGGGVGGGSKQLDIETLERNLPTILVSTPGRLKDHIATTNIKLTQQLVKVNRSEGRQHDIGTYPYDDTDDGFGGDEINDDDELSMTTTPTTMTTVHKPFSKILQHSVQTLVLDETDRLLELGFRKDILDIVSFLPSASERQTLFFSATLPPKVLDVIDSLTSTSASTTTKMKMKTTPNNKKPNSGGHVGNSGLTKNYELIDCIKEDDPSTHTNERTTKQSYVVVPNDRFWISSIEVIWDLMNSRPKKKERNNKSNGSVKNSNKKNKIMVFFPMTSLVQLYANLFNLRFGKRVLELHGKMYQRERSIISRRFRNSSDGILFTSDVSARGVDYPNVTHVVQVGAPQSRETYIHRLGRTGRAGKEGEGLLILPDLEKGFIDELIDSPTDPPFSRREDFDNSTPFSSMNIKHNAELQRQLLRPSRRKGPQYQQLREELGRLRHDLYRRNDPTISSSLHLSYQAMISYYFQRIDWKQSDDVVGLINQLVDDLGSNELPEVDERRAKKIGIDAIPGLNIRKSWNERRWDSGWMDNNNYSSDEFYSGNDHYDFDDFDHGSHYQDQSVHFHRLPVGNFENVFEDRNDGGRGRPNNFEDRSRYRAAGGGGGRSNRYRQHRSDNQNDWNWSRDSKQLLDCDDRRLDKDGWNSNKSRRPPRKHGSSKDFRRRSNNFFQRWEQPGVFRTKS